jgi:hypothetical protein
MRMLRSGILLGLLLSVAVCGPLLGQQEQPEEISWLTGSAVDRQLQQPLKVVWEEVPLRRLLKSLSTSTRLAIFLDRRVDPGKLISFEAKGESMAAALQLLTSQHQLGYCLVDSTLYVGPATVTSRLATVSEVLSDFLNQLPEPWRRRCAARRPLAWPRLSSPRDLVAQQLQQAMITLAKPQSIPHDLWDAGELPAMPLAHRLTILLAGFDRAFTIQGDPPQLQLIPLPEQVQLQRVYNKQVSNANFSRLLEFFPDLELTRSGDKLTAVGRQEDHRQLARLLRGEQVATVTSDTGDKRYRLKVDNAPIEQIIAAIARQDELQVDIDEAARARWDKMIPLDARDVTREKLLELILSPAKLTGRVEGKKLIIRCQP